MAKNILLLLLSFFFSSSSSSFRCLHLFLFIRSSFFLGFFFFSRYLLPFVVLVLLSTLSFFLFFCFLFEHIPTVKSTSALYDHFSVFSSFSRSRCPFLSFLCFTSRARERKKKNHYYYYQHQTNSVECENVC